MTIMNPYHLEPYADVKPMTLEEQKQLRGELKTDQERANFDRRVASADAMFKVLDQKRQQLPHKTADWNAEERQRQVQLTRELYQVASQSFWAEQRRIHQTQTRPRKR